MFKASNRCDVQVLQFMPLIANSEHFFEPVWSTYHQDWLLFDSAARYLISWQHLTFVPLLMVAKFGARPPPTLWFILCLLLNAVLCD